MFKKKKSKMNVSRQSLALLIITPIAILAIILVIMDIYNRQKNNDIEKTETGLEIEIDREEIEAIVPDSDTELTEEQRQVIAVPESSASSNPASGTMSQNRSFNFNLENDNLINTGNSGKEINVYIYDNIILNFTAIDKDYDINMPEFFGKTIDVKVGETATRMFQVSNAGSFPYYCEVCGGINSPASGLINVVNRE